MSRTPRLPLAAAAVCVGLLFAVMAAAYWWPAAHGADAAALHTFESIHRPWLDRIANAALWLCDTVQYTAIVAILVVLVARWRSPRHALAAFVLLAGANVSSQVLKPLLAHDRIGAPWHIRHLVAAAYPSGHATAAMSLALAMVLVVPRAWRPIAAAAGGIFALAVSFSALMFGWHYPSDIVGGFLLATVWSLLVLAGMRVASVRWPQRGGMRQAARRALSVPTARVARGALGLPLLALAVIGVTRAGQIAGYADHHHAFVFVTTAIALSAAGLLSGVTALSSRRR